MRPCQGRQADMKQRERVRNRLLNGLSESDYQRIASDMEAVELALGEVVAHRASPLEWAFFPLTAVLCTMTVLSDGDTMEGCAVGNEGMEGLCLLTDELSEPDRITVLVKGEVLRIRAATFRRQAKERLSMSQLLTRYLLFLARRGAHNAACIQHHAIEERMCRWLLETADRNGQDRFHFTQESLSQMLGVRRQSVNTAARHLQQAGLITYHRSKLTIVDRCGLEEASCECYRSNRVLYEQTITLPNDTKRGDIGDEARQERVPATFPHSFMRKIPRRVPKRGGSMPPV
jgi:CRP-like cAMP-binding protein